MDNPVQTKCSTGKRNHYIRELRSSSIDSRQGQVFSVELLRSSVGGDVLLNTPCCTSFARGYPYSSPTDLGIVSNNITLTLIFREQCGKNYNPTEKYLLL
jgi:hypothetical protein